MTRRLNPAAFLSVLAVSAAAFATVEVFVNGVPAAGLPPGTKLEHCNTLEVDAKGNIHIACPEYDLKSTETAPAPAPAAPVALSTSPAPAGGLAKHYWLVTQQATKGAAGFDIDVFVNAKWIKKLKNDDDQIVMEITKYLVPGQNKVIFAAKKRLDLPRVSTSPGVVYSVIVGEGEAGGQNVMIDNPLFEVKRTAAEMQDVNEEYTVTAR